MNYNQLCMSPSNGEDTTGIWRNHTRFDHWEEVTIYDNCCKRLTPPDICSIITATPTITIPTIVRKLVKGINLKLLVNVLALHPTIPHTSIIDSAKWMLKLPDSIKQHTLSHSWFKNKVLLRDPSGTTNKRREHQSWIQVLQLKKPKPSPTIRQNERGLKSNHYCYANRGMSIKVYCRTSSRCGRIRRSWNYNPEIEDACLVDLHFV